MGGLVASSEPRSAICENDQQNEENLVDCGLGMEWSGVEVVAWSGREKIGEKTKEQHNIITQLLWLQLADPVVLRAGVSY